MQIKLISKNPVSGYSASAEVTVAAINRIMSADPVFFNGKSLTIILDQNVTRRDVAGNIVIDPDTGMPQRMLAKYSGNTITIDTQLATANDFGGVLLHEIAHALFPGMTDALHDVLDKNPEADITGYTKQQVISEIGWRLKLQEIASKLSLSAEQKERITATAYQFRSETRGENREFVSCRRNPFDTENLSVLCVLSVASSGSIEAGIVKYLTGAPKIGEIGDSIPNPHLRHAIRRETGNAYPAVAIPTLSSPLWTSPPRRPNR